MQRRGAGGSAAASLSEFVPAALFFLARGRWQHAPCHGRNRLRLLRLFRLLGFLVAAQLTFCHVDSPCLGWRIRAGPIANAWVSMKVGQIRNSRSFAGAVYPGSARSSCADQGISACAGESWGGRWRATLGASKSCRQSRMNHHRTGFALIAAIWAFAAATACAQGHAVGKPMKSRAPSSGWPAPAHVLPLDKPSTPTVAPTLAIRNASLKSL